MIGASVSSKVRNGWFSKFHFFCFYFFASLRRILFFFKSIIVNSFISVFVVTEDAPIKLALFSGTLQVARGHLQRTACHTESHWTLTCAARAYSQSQLSASREHSRSTLEMLVSLALIFCCQRRLPQLLLSSDTQLFLQTLVLSVQNEF